MGENRNKEQSRIRYPFVNNFLSQRLVIEEADLERWNEIIQLNRDELSVRQAKGNISSCQHRITELKTVIEEIKIPLIPEEETIDKK